MTIVTRPGDVFTFADGRRIELTAGSVLQVADGSIATRDGQRSRPLGEKPMAVAHRPMTIN